MATNKINKTVGIVPTSGSNSSSWWTGQTSAAPASTSAVSTPSVPNTTASYAKAATVNPVTSAQRAVASSTPTATQTNPYAKATGTTATTYSKTPTVAQTSANPYAKSGVSGIAEGTQVGVPTNVYRVQDSGKAPVGLGVGDQVVTGGGTYEITGVNPDGSYQSRLANAAQTTGTYTGSYGSTVMRPDGVVQKAFDWKYDPTDYAARMLSAQSGEEFSAWAQDRVHQTNAQGRDISGNGAERSNTDLFNEWYNAVGKKLPTSFKATDHSDQVGYYGMDADGHWGYYLDPELTQKHPNGNWDKYKASDGGYARFDTSNGYLWPSLVRDDSRAGKTVTLVAGNKAFEVTYNDSGYVSSVLNLTQARGIDGADLDLPTAKSSGDRGVGGQELLRQTTGYDYAGPGSGFDFNTDGRAATREDYAALMGAQTGGYDAGFGAGEYGSGGASGGETSGGAYASGGGYAAGGYPASTYPTDAGTAGAGGGTGTAGASLTDELRGLYNGQDSVYMQALADLRAANEAAVQRATNTLEGSRESTNQSYADLFRQLYIDRMNNQRGIEQRMAAQGVTGGAAESTLLGLGTQYEDALRQGEQSRISAMSDIDRAIEDARLTGDISTAENAANLARENVNNYADALRSLIAQQNTDRAFNYQASRDAISDARYENQLAYQQQQAAQQLAYAQQQDEYDRRLRLAQLAAQYGDYAGLNDLGVDTTSYASALAAEQAASAAKPTLTVAQVNSAIKNNTANQAVLDAYQYYYGVPYGSTGTTPYTGYAANGATYSIGSTAGINFVRNAKAGETLTGGDGSKWVKNADGSVTIYKNGVIYTVG